jgi:hypothetical protein
MSSTDSPNGAVPPPPTRLNGWKEIAAYFGKGVRTVQRWEKELGLPVHRIGSAAGEIVYALPPELDRWQASAAARKGIRDAAAANGENHEPAPVEQPAPQPEPPPPPAIPGPSRLRRATLLVLLGLVAGTLIWFWHVLPAASGQPASFRILNKALVIYDADGRFLWDHPFEFPLTESSYFTDKALEEKLTPVSIEDIDGDGNMEVLFVSEPWLPGSRGLFCFDSRGIIRFHHAPDRKVQFGEKTYGPPWRGVSVLVTGVTGKAHDIWFVSTHLEEFPTVLEKLDASGNVKGEYWSNGQISRVVVGQLAGRPRVFVGAINNESKEASLAVLDARNPSGAAPAVSDHYRCTGCPPGAPEAFLLFPRLDVAVAVEDHAEAAAIFVDALGQIMVDVRHNVGDPVAPELRTAASSHYTLDSQFRVRTAELGRRVHLIHDVFEKEGLLDHPFSIARDSLQLWPVLRWNGNAFIEVRGPETVK